MAVFTILHVHCTFIKNYLLKRLLWLQMKSQSRLYNHYGHVFILFILVSEGDRIAQLILERILTPEVKEVEVREERGWLVSGVLYREGYYLGI